MALYEVLKDSVLRVIVPDNLRASHGGADAVASLIYVLQARNFSATADTEATLAASKVSHGARNMEATARAKIGRATPSGVCIKGRGRATLSHTGRRSARATGGRRGTPIGLAHACLSASGRGFGGATCVRRVARYVGRWATLSPHFSGLNNRAFSVFVPAVPRATHGSKGPAAVGRVGKNARSRVSGAPTARGSRWASTSPNAATGVAGGFGAVRG